MCYFKLALLVILDHSMQVVLVISAVGCCSLVKWKKMFIQNGIQSKRWNICRNQNDEYYGKITLKTIFFLFFWCLWIDFFFFWLNPASIQHTNKANMFKYNARYYNYRALEDLNKLLKNKMVIYKNIQKKNQEREFNQKGKKSRKILNGGKIIQKQIFVW